jgi:AcrR family transcriptional regulator
MRATNPASAEDPKRGRLLEAAVGVFLRYGFKKTSMEEVARAAHLSRQGLYLHYSTKEELFRAALGHALATGLDAAQAALRDDARPVEQRLVAAFEAWMGRYVGSMGRDVADLQEASELLTGSLMADHEQVFIDAVAKLVRSSGLAGAYKAAGVTARQIAEMLYASARGLKHACSSPAEFAERFAVAARITCAPLLTDQPARRTRDAR